MGGGVLEGRRRCEVESGGGRRGLSDGATVGTWRVDEGWLERPCGEEVRVGCGVYVKGVKEGGGMGASRSASVIWG